MSGVTTVISGEILRCGAISFARFMEQALYAPGLGYYEQAAGRVGRGGDFYTSVSVGPLFGELLAFQFSTWLEELTRGLTAGAGLGLVEAGAHDGKLAADILRWLQSHRPALFANLEYRILEPSPARRIWQEQTLREFAPRVKWFSSWAQMTAVRGVIFSNELLDAFPVHRLGWDAVGKKWFEWGVAGKDGGFVWRRLDNDITNIAPELPQELLAVLPDGFSTEVCPAAEHWWREAAGTLATGKLFTVDYGLNEAEFFSPQRGQGTLRSYLQHRTTADVLAQPGEQDITAQVNFTRLQSAGESAGLRTDEFVSQTKFLTRLVEKFCGAEMTPEEFAANRARQFLTLTHPDHLGRSFRVLVQARG